MSCLGDCCAVLGFSSHDGAIISDVCWRTELAGMRGLSRFPLSTLPRCGSAVRRCCVYGVTHSTETFFKFCLVLTIVKLFWVYSP